MKKPIIIILALLAIGGTVAYWVKRKKEKEPPTDEFGEGLMMDTRGVPRNR